MASFAGTRSRIFNEQQPVLDIARYDGRNAQDEREGFKFLFSGAMLALRNPRGLAGHPLRAAV